MSVQTTETAETETAETIEYAGGSAFKPLLYILVLPIIVIALLQWSHLPALLVQSITGP